MPAFAQSASEVQGTTGSANDGEAALPQNPQKTWVWAERSADVLLDVPW